METRNQNRKARGRRLTNLAASILFVCAALLFIWGGLFLHARNFRSKNLELYRDRQHAVIYLMYDLLNMAREQYGDLSLSFLEMQLERQMRAINSGQKAPKSLYSEHDDLAGYGNAFLLYNGRAIYAGGEFARYFKPADNYYECTNPRLRIYLDRINSELTRSPGDHAIKSTDLEIDGRRHLFTAARFKLGAGNAVFVMHADQERILRDHGYYARLRDYTMVCSVVSVVMLILGAFLVVGIRRESRQTEQLQETTDQLRREIHERAALTDELRKFKTVADTANAGIAICDPGGRLQYVNATFRRMCGYGDGDMIGVTVRDCFPGESGAFLDRIAARDGTESRVEPVELWAQRKDRSQFPALMTGAAIPGPDGAPAWMAIVAIDSTERREAVMALRAGEQKYRGIFNESVAAVFVFDQDKNFTDANHAGLELLGYSRNELLAMNFLDVLPDPGAMRLALQQLLAGGRIINFEHPLTHKSGRTVTVLNNSRPLTGEHGAVQGILSTLVDITDRRHIQQKLHRNQERFQRLVENLKDDYFFFSHDTGGVFTYVSPSVTGILGYTPEQFTTHYTQYLADGPNREHVIQYTEMSLEGNEQPGYEVEVVHKNGGTHTLEIKEYPVFDQNGQVLGVEGIARDVTERKRAEAEREELQAQLLQAQKMEAVGRLAGGIAHDFNNILAVMIGSSELVLRKMDKDDPNAARVGKILESGKRASDLTMQLLTFARKDKLHVQTVPLNQLFGELVTMLKRTISKKITIATELDPELPLVSVDVNQVVQALLNICINACDAMGNRGTLNIESTSEDVTPSMCRTLPDASPGEYCVVTVRDNGPGIPEQIRQKIFEPFFTTKHNGAGTGLGLSVSLGIIRSHDGFITMDTEQNVGTCVRVFLPTVQSVEHARRPAVMSTINPRAGSTVLVVDDNREFLAMAQDILSVLGYKTQVAKSGREALVTYKEKHNEIDLVLLDMMMPELDGSDVFSALKDANPRLKIILCSGYSLDGVAGRLLREGAAAFLQKPFDIKEFSQTLAHVLSVS